MSKSSRSRNPLSARDSRDVDNVIWALLVRGQSVAEIHAQIVAGETTIGHPVSISKSAIYRRAQKVRRERDLSPLPGEAPSREDVDATLRVLEMRVTKDILLRAKDGPLCPADVRTLAVLKAQSNRIPQKPKNPKRKAAGDAGTKRSALEELEKDLGPAPTDSTSQSTDSESSTSEARELAERNSPRHPNVTKQHDDSEEQRGLSRTESPLSKLRQASPA